MKNFTTLWLCQKGWTSPKTFFTIKILIVITFALFALLPSCKTEKNEITPQKRYVLGYVRATDEEFANIRKAPAPITAGILPPSYLLDIPPTPFNQGQQGSCASSATAGAKSILDHLQFATPYLNNSIIYSPSYLYNQVHVVPSDCNSGSSGPANFNILISQGDCQITDMVYDPTSCSTLPNSTQQNLAGSHKIGQFLSIDPISAATIKQYIYGGLPVIVAFQVDDNFENSNATSVWSTFGTESLGWHCTLLYGWDDSKNAFRMLNSWGSSWGDNGSTWVDYNFVENGSSPVWGKIFAEAYVIENSAVQNNQPIADFDLNGASNTINQNQSITFHDKSLNNPTSWVWTFQGGNPDASNLQNPTVTYPNAGSFTVTLNVSNSNGSNSKTVSNFIIVNSAIQKPVAQFSTNGSTSISPGTSVSFINQSSNNPTTYSWSFPGGNPTFSSSLNPTVMYSTPGVFSVSLTATNQGGSDTKTVTNYITVKQTQPWTCGQPFTDPRDGQVYSTVNINGTCWLAENLKYTNNNQVGIVYGNSASANNTYGLLYSFNDVINGNLAPPGWHIPSSSEVVALSQYILLNYSNNSGVLKSTSNLWIPPNLGANNAIGFSALPSGYFYNGSFNDAGSVFYMWTSTSQSAGGNAATLSTNSTGMGLGYFNGNYYFAIRCVKD